MCRNLCSLSQEADLWATEQLKLFRKHFVTASHLRTDILTPRYTTQLSIDQPISARYQAEFMLRARAC